MADILFSLGFDSSTLAKEANAALSSLSNILGNFQMPNVGMGALQMPKIDPANFNIAKASLGELEQLYTQLRNDFTKGGDTTMLSFVESRLKSIKTELTGVSEKAGKKPFDMATASAGELQRELSRLQRSFTTGMDSSQIVAIRERLRETKIEMGQISGESFVDRLKNAFSQSLSDATNWQQNILEIAGGNIIANLFEKVGESVINVGKYAINSAAEFESLRASLDVISGSSLAGGKLFGEFQQLANKSPFNFSEVGEFGKQLVAVGVPLSDVTNRLSRIGDISAGVGRDKLPSLVRAYGQVKSAGVAMSEEINQISETGVPIIETLSEVLGKPTDQIKKLASESKISFKDIDAAFVKLTDNGGKFYGMMQAQANGFEGLWSSMEDSFQVLAASIGTRMLPIAKSIVISITDAANAVTEFVNNIGEIDKSIGGFGNIALIIGGITLAFNAATIATLANNAVTYAATLAQGAFNAIASIGNAIRMAVATTAIIMSGGFGTATIATNLLTAAQTALNFVMSPIGFLAVAGAAAAAYGAYKIYETYLNRTTVQEQYAADTKQSLIEKYKDERGKIDALFLVLNNEKAKRNEQVIAAKEVVKMYNDLGIEYVNESALLSKGDAALKERKRLQEELRDATLDRISETYKNEQIALIQNELLSTKLKQKAVNEGQITGVEAIGAWGAFREGFSLFMEGNLGDAEAGRQKVSKVLDEQGKESIAKMKFLSENLKSTNAEIKKLLSGEDLTGLFDTNSFMKKNQEAIKEGFASNSLAGYQERLKVINEELSKTSGKSGSFDNLAAAAARLNDRVKELQDRIKLIGLNADSLAGLQARLSIIQENLNKANPNSDSFDKAIAKTVELNKRIKELQDRIKEGSLAAGSMEMLNFQLQKIQDQLNKTSDTNVIRQLTAQSIEAEKAVGRLKVEMLKARMELDNPNIKPLGILDINAAKVDEIRARMDSIIAEIGKVKNTNPKIFIDLGLDKTEVLSSLESQLGELNTELLNTPKNYGISLDFPVLLSFIPKAELNKDLLERARQEAFNQMNLGDKAGKGNGIEDYFKDLQKLNESTQSNPFQSVTEGAYAFADALGMAHEGSINFATDFTAAMVEVSKTVAGAFGDILFSFGEGIGGLMVGVTNFSEVMQKALFDLGKAILVQVPKTIGLGLIQSAFTPQALATFPANLALVGIGLGLLGISGIASGALGGLENKNKAKKEAQMPNVNQSTNLPQSQSIIGGGGLSAAEPNITFTPSITIVMENVDGIIKEKITHRVEMTEKFK